ncbi:MAG: AAA family ATPase [Spirochaetia bacterium]|nr:AAA family ATPase [Spirochaetia bacterium]
MLLELRIENFGIIDEMRLHPGQGLSVLTGETGAGKSLIIQSLMAVLGARVGAGVVRSGAARAILEARFQTPQDLVASLPPGSEELLLRREIGTDGKSRSWSSSVERSCWLPPSGMEIPAQKTARGFHAERRARIQIRIFTPRSH